MFNLFKSKPKPSHNDSFINADAEAFFHYKLDNIYTCLMVFPLSMAEEAKDLCNLYKEKYKNFLVDFHSFDEEDNLLFLRIYANSPGDLIQFGRDVYLSDTDETIGKTFRAFSDQEQNPIRTLREAVREKEVSPESKLYPLNFVKTVNEIYKEMEN